MSDSVTTDPGVLVVLVAHDGAEWLPDVLDALEQQTYPNIEVIAVDNISQDGGRDVLLQRLGAEQVLIADRDLGFGAAVGMALDARSAIEHPYVLTLHDDCALEPDAIEVLVRSMEADPRLAAVGPKLRAWRSDATTDRAHRPGTDRAHHPRELQSVGWTVDVTGRADSGVDEGELDQGQRDQERRTLYVSTAAMLLRRATFDEVGRFDRRYHVFRDDLDLCWRLWLAGHEVEVRPDAVGRHVAGATNYLRLGQTRFIGPRYFAERNTLATLLKNYGRARLLGIVPLYFLVGIAKVLGFLLTRRVSDAWQTVRAWIWNLLHLRETWRLRRIVQAGRRRDDRELRELFGRVVPRMRAYLEAIVEWVAGADVAAAPSDEHREQRETEPETATRRLVRFVRSRPVLVVGIMLAVLGTVGAWQLLLPGTLRGGDLAPWPAHASAFLADHLAGWHEANVFGTAETPSPAQALLGALQLVLFGSDYLAPRALLLGSFAVAWLLALRAAQTYSQRRLPRVAAATAYVLSPPALAAVSTGRVGALVVFATLPGIVAAGVTLSTRRTPPKRAWRAVAGGALLTAIAAAFEPLLLAPVLAIGLLVAIVGSLVAQEAAWRRALLARLSVAIVGPVVLLLPWSFHLVMDGGLLVGGVLEPVGDPLWRWLLLAPGLPAMPGLAAGVGFLLAGLLGLVLGFPRSPRVVLTLWTVALLGAVAGWALDRAGVGVWAGLPLLATAGAYAGLLALAFATAESQLTAHDFGWRQLAALATAVGVTISLVSVAAAFVREPWDAFTDTASLPSFITRAAEDGDPFRVLVLADTEDGVSWEIVDGTGPTMAAYGVPRPQAALDLAGEAVDDLLARRDPGAAARLAALNVRYVAVPAAGVSEALDEALLAQEQLEPRPIADGRVLTVVGAMPRGAVMPPDAADRVEELAPVPDDTEVASLDALGGGRYRGEVDDGASIVIAEAADEGFVIEVGTTTLVPDGDTLVRFDDVPGGTLEVSHAGARARSLALGGQLFAVLLAFSLALRPPRFARSFGDDEPPPEVEQLRDDHREAVAPSEAVEIEAQLAAGSDPAPGTMEPEEQP